MAWTRLLPSGQYQGCYRTAAGEIRSAGTFRQRKQALRAAIGAEDAIRQPGAVDPRDGTIGWGSWFELWHESRSLAFATDQTYRSTADCHLMPTWRDVCLVDIDELSIQRWMKRLATPRSQQQRPCSPWTVRSALMLLKTSLNAAVRARRLGVSPAAHVPYPDLPAGLERYLTPGEVDAITFYMDGGNALIVWTSIQTGLRFGELAGLHWSRLDLDRGLITVVEKFDQKANVMDPLPKDNEQRTVPLPDDLVAMLVRYRDHAAPQRQDTCGVAHVAGRCLGDVVFRGARGAVLKSNEWGRGPWARALKLAGIEGRVRPHDMRHTYASWLLQQGVHLAELARMMGHSSWEVTRRYAHLSEQGYDTVRQALDDHRRAARRAANPGFTGLSAVTREAAEDVI